MIRKKVLSIGNNSATLLVQDTEANGALRVLRRMNVTGWSEVDVKMVEEAYETLRKARLRGFVPIHTVLVQNSFLSVVASYAPEGDVSTFLEEEVDAPLEEPMVLRWLCACALSIREMQTYKLYFPGLTTDRLFLDHQTGGTAQILLGVPLPLPVYISQMQDRRKNGVKVSLDYPPEVLTEPNWSFHGTATDVWSLGRLGEVLLTAKGTGLARRSGSTRQLIARMMASEPAKRPSMESVAQSLIALAGNVKLGQPVWPAKTANATSASLGPPPPPPSHPPPVVTGETGHVARGNQHHLLASDNIASVHPVDSRTSSPPPEVPATRPHESRKKLEVATAPPPSPSPSLQQHQSAQPPGGPHRDPIPRPTYAPDDSWHQRAQQQFEQLQRLNASPQKGRGEGPVSPRGSKAEGNFSSPRRGGVRGSGVVDHNTRMLNEMFAEQENLYRDANGERPQRRTGQHVEDLQQLQADAVRQMKLATAQRQHEMRKHFTEWQRQNNQRYTGADNALVMEQDGVVIIAPRPVSAAPPPPPASSSAATAASTSVRSEKAGDGHSTPPTTTASDEGPSEAPLPTALSSSAQNVPARSSKTRPKTTPTASPVRRIVPKSTASTLTKSNWASTNAPGGLVVAATAIRSSASTRPEPAPQLSSIAPHIRESNESKPCVAAKLSDDDVNAGERNTQSASAPSRRVYADLSTLSAVQWSVDGIRSTLRTLLRNRDIYGDVMQEVAVFVSQKEEARLSAHANEVFMQRLRKLLPEDRLFYGAVPLCAQLVALEGLDHTLRNSIGARPSR